MNEAFAYSCTTGMLEVARERGLEDQRIFKVILGLRKVIQATGRRFIHERRDFKNISSWNPRLAGLIERRRPGWQNEGFGARQEQAEVAFKNMCKAFVSENLLNIKAWGWELKESRPSSHGRRTAWYGPFIESPKILGKLRG